MLKKITLLAMTVAAFAALTVPAAAQAEASSWTMNEKPLEEEGTITAHGTIAFEVTGAGGISCNSEIHADLTANSDVGNATSLELSECVSFGLLSMICGEIEEVVVSALPTFTGTTVGTPGTGAIDVHGLEGRYQLESNTANCPNGGEINIVTGDDPILTMDSASAMTTLIVEGAVSTTVGTADLKGHLTITTGSGTYGVS